MLSLWDVWAIPKNLSLENQISLGAQVNGRLGPPLLCLPIFGEAGYFNCLSFASCQEGERAVAAVVGEECKSEAYSEWSGKGQAGMHEGKAQSIA